MKKQEKWTFRFIYYTKWKEETIVNSSYINNDLVNKISFILPKINLSQMNDIKPTLEELKYWLYTGQIKNSNYKKRKISKKVKTSQIVKSYFLS